LVQLDTTNGVMLFAVDPQRTGTVCRNAAYRVEVGCAGGAAGAGK
jgi:hypothetical protein